ncbi:GNAT family N-acetyltransferase [Streptomyces sp. NPDC048639]|uniref:GNAT family N-acetyltransferase n=1 Tax=Streptomyces sp. NPDC048639 TaxID=3365581 RepID=UPI0037143730
MTGAGPSAEVTENADKARYEVRVGADLAGFAEYRARNGRIVFTHTEIDPAFQGRGLARALAGAALDDVRERGLTATPLCPFIADYIRRNPQYAEIVDPAHRGRLAD